MQVDNEENWWKKAGFESLLMTRKTDWKRFQTIEKRDSVMNWKNESPVTRD